MMILAGYTWIDVLISTLWVTLILLVAVIGYRTLLRFLQKDRIRTEDYCELHELELNPAHGEVAFYFTSEKSREYSLLVLDTDMSPIEEIIHQECNIGGNIVRFDTTKIPDGNYFYCLKTDNQKVMKKMVVKNGN